MALPFTLLSACKEAKGIWRQIKYLSVQGKPFHLFLLSFPAPLWKCLLLSTCLERHSRNSRTIIPTPYQSLILPVPQGRDLLLGVSTNKATWLLTPRHPGYWRKCRITYKKKKITFIWRMFWCFCPASAQNFTVTPQSCFKLSRHVPVDGVSVVYHTLMCAGYTQSAVNSLWAQYSSSLGRKARA